MTFVRNLMVLFTVLAVLVGCKKEQPVVAPAPVAAAEPEVPPAPVEPEDWSAENGAARVAQRRLKDGTCRISSRGATAWEESVCHGDKTAQAFVSSGGDKVILLMTLPAVSEDDVTVVEVLDHGRLMRAGVARAFLGKDAKVRRFTYHLAWLSGTAQLPGEPPSLQGERVVFSTIEGKRFSIGFDGAGIPEAPPRAAPAPA